jgi:hypothetical protein
MLYGIAFVWLKYKIKGMEVDFISVLAVEFDRVYLYF